MPNKFGSVVEVEEKTKTLGLELHRMATESPAAEVNTIGAPMGHKDHLVPRMQRDRSGRGWGWISQSVESSKVVALERLAVSELTWYPVRLRHVNEGIVTLKGQVPWLVSCFSSPSCQLTEMPRSMRACP